MRRRANASDMSSTLVVDGFGETGHLCDGEDLVHAEHAAHGMHPPHQRLDREHGAVGGGDDRLEERLDLARGPSAPRNWSRWRRRWLIESIEISLRSRVGVALVAHELIARTRQHRLESRRTWIERAGGTNSDVDLLILDDNSLGHFATDSLTQATRSPRPSPNALRARTRRRPAVR